MTRRRAEPVLLVTDLFPPDIGGPATFVPRLAAGLAGRGHPVTVVCRADDPRASGGDRWPFRVVRTPRFGGPRRRLGLLAVLAREVLRHRVIFTNGLERTTALACRSLGRRYTLKVVGDVAWERARGEGLTELGLDEFQSAPAAPPWARWVSRRAAFARAARLVITPSEYLRRIVVGWGVDPRRTVTVPNGVALDEFRAFAPARRERGRPLEVIWVGRMVSHKGLDVLLAAVCALDGVRLTLVGDGPMAPALRAMAARDGLEPVVAFHGACPRGEALARLARSHVLALPSQYEGLSHALIEACAAGVPAVASDRGGNPEVIEHGRSGLLAPYGRVDDLRDALRRLRDDEDLRLRLADGARVRSRGFDVEATVARTIELMLP